VVRPFLFSWSEAYLVSQNHPQLKAEGTCRSPPPVPRLTPDPSQENWYRYPEKSCLSPFVFAFVEVKGVVILWHLHDCEYMANKTAILQFLPFFVLVRTFLSLRNESCTSWANDDFHIALHLFLAKQPNACRGQVVLRYEGDFRWMKVSL
jgi:hypothetical protein